MPVIIAILLALWYFGYMPGCASSRYAAEVGYYQGDSISWDLWGDYASLEECRSAAIGRYNGKIVLEKWNLLPYDGPS